MSVLLAYSTTDGHTKTIVQYIQHQLQQQGINCSVKQATEVHATDIAAHRVFVLGASVRYGKHQKSVYRLVQQHIAALQSKPNVFFSVNVVARKAGKNTAQGNPYVRRFLQKITWQPQHVAVLAGKIDYPRYRWFDKHIIRFIMHLTGGPTDTSACFDFTNWHAINQLTHTIANMARSTKTLP